jgi:FkbM family methyltransferase
MSKRLAPMGTFLRGLIGRSGASFYRKLLNREKIPLGGNPSPAIPFPRLAVPPQVFDISIVDVGAQLLSYETDIYAPLRSAGRCRIVGFDPFADPKFASPGVVGADTLRNDAEVTVLPYFIGTGQKARFHVNHFSPTSSLYPSNTALMRDFTSLAEICSTKSVIEVETRRLDDVKEIADCDFLKVDVQGGDYDVVSNATATLEKALFVHIEAEFSELYVGQPLFADIDVLMRARRFQLIDLVKPGWNNYRALISESMRSRLLWADCIYMKAPELIAERDPDLLVRAAFIAHVNYGKYDLAAHLLQHHDRRRGGSLLEEYSSAVKKNASI